MLALSAAGLRAETFTIEGAVARALRANSDLAAARLSIEEARGRLWQSGRPANPELETELKPNVRGREGSFSIGLMQKFPLTNRLHLEQKVSRAALAAAEAEVRNAERLLKAEVRTVAVKLLALDALKALNDQQRKNSTELMEAAARTAKVGEGSPLEPAHFELEVQQLSLELLQADAERAALTGMLRPLLGMGPSQNVRISGELSEPAAPGKGASPERRPDYQAALAKEDAARTGVDLARAGKWEDAGLSLTYEREHMHDAGSGFERENFIGLKFTLPLPFWNKNEGKIYEASAAAARAQKETESLAQRIRAEAAAAHAEMAAAARIIEQTSGPLMKKAVELEERHLTANKLGQSPLTDVLRSRERRFALEAAHRNALRDYHLARVRLMAAQGR